MSRNISVSLNAEQAAWVDALYEAGGQAMTKSQIVRECVELAKAVRELYCAAGKRPATPQAALLLLDGKVPDDPETAAAVSMLWDYVLFRIKEENGG